LPAAGFDFFEHEAGRGCVRHHESGVSALSDCACFSQRKDEKAAVCEACYACRDGQEQRW
jgi:hypothetical protein